MSLRIAIDTGGTFTDVIAIDETTGDQFAIKTPSTPDDPSRGLLNGITEVTEVAGGDVGSLSQVLHGTTTATNAVLEHRFEGLGLLMSKGFRHVIEIARQSVPDGYGNSFFWVKPPRLVPLHLVREIDERLKFDGTVLTSLDEQSVIDAVEDLVDFGVTRLAVCLLHSYANPAHEQRVGEIIAERFPDIFVSLSSVVLPEYREYERAMTTLIDVMVKPYCKTYLNRARDQIKERTGEKPFLIMQSNGGIVSSDAAGERPVTMLLSGPAGGVLGATHMARLAGFDDILTLDVGGTSTDVSLVRELTPQLSTLNYVENYPVKTPMLDVVAVGAGGRLPGLDRSLRGAQGRAAKRRRRSRSDLLWPWWNRTDRNRCRRSSRPVTERVHRRWSVARDQPCPRSIRGPGSEARSTGRRSGRRRA